MDMVSLFNSIAEVFRYRKGVVVSEIEEAPKVKTVSIKIEDNFYIEPGQFNMLYVWGIGEIPISLSNLPIKHRYHTIVEHTIRSVGAVSKAFIEIVKIGSVVGVRGPYGRGWPTKEFEGMDVVIIAGGIGMAPLRPLIKYVKRFRERFGRINILYGARTPMDLLYKYELEDYMAMSNTKVMLSSDRYVEGWRYHVGFVTDLIDFTDVDIGNAVAFVCGPEVMMKIAVKKLLAKGFKGHRILLSLERRMRCGIGICGTCQFGHYFVCRDGPVFRYSDIENYLDIEGI